MVHSAVPASTRRLSWIASFHSHGSSVGPVPSGHVAGDSARLREVEELHAPVGSALGALNPIGQRARRNILWLAPSEVWKGPLGSLFFRVESRMCLLGPLSHRQVVFAFFTRLPSVPCIPGPLPDLVEPPYSSTRRGERCVCRETEALKH